MYRSSPWLLILLFVPLYAQENHGADTEQRILDRLDALEKQNQQIVNEIHMLREQLNERRHPTSPDSPAGNDKVETLEQRLEVQENRTSEQAQTKVEAAHKYPIQLTGMLLFNAFANGGGNRGESGVEYNLLAGPERVGATLRQTILGLEFQGPSLPGAGRLNGYLFMDFWGGPVTPGNNWIRLRRAGVSLDWKRRSIFLGQDKPIIAPYQPDSLAEVGVPPLAGAGNLWFWLPQVRYDEKIPLGPNTTLTGQIAALQTNESYYGSNSRYPIQQARPALEGRLALSHKFDDIRSVEIGSGFHLSTSHVAGSSIASLIASIDFLIVPSSHFRVNGTAYRGENVAGLGSLGNLFSLYEGELRPVPASGAWLQTAFPITERLTVNLYGGLESDQIRGYLPPAALVRNWSYASNILYHLGPNVVLSVEAAQLKTRFVQGTQGTHNHYDLALGYLF